MEAVKTIDALYEEVRGYDIVLCNDAPLTTALNNRVDKPMLGHFAVTPRQLAASMAIEVTGQPIIDDIRLVKKVADDTGYGLRYVHGEIQNFTAAVRYTREPRMGRKSRRVWNAYNQYNTLDRLMLNIDDAAKEYLKGKKVAVIGLALFDELDKHILPLDFDEIDIMDHGSEFTIPSIRILGNDRQIAECAADLAKRCGPKDVAIVMDTGGAMADAVKSALYRESLPFINSLNVRDLGTVRNFLEFVQLALSFETIRVRDVRELISAYGGLIYSKYDKYYLSKFRDTGIKRSQRTDELLDIMSSVADRTFGDVCSSCVPSADRPSVTMLLDQMECKDDDVTQDLLDDLVYAVNSISSLTHNEQISPDEKSGVLLVDCKNSVYIDRPVVIYAGMCSEWEIDLNGLDYIDSKKRPEIEDGNITRFNALIQQGSVRFYLVNATKGGEEAVPCKYFDACIRMKYYSDDNSWVDEGDGSTEPVSSFGQIAEDVIRGPWRIEKRDRSAKAGEEFLEDERPPEVFSNSSYMKFIECPRQYMLSRLAGTPDNTYTHTGNRIHEYAEFRISYPDITKEKGPEYYAGLIAEECAPLNSPDLETIERSKITAAVKAIDMFIESLGIEPGELVRRSEEKKDKNMFLELHGLEQKSEHAEVPLTYRDDALHGIIDLLWDGIAFDFKTGGPKTASELASKYDIFSMGDGEKLKDHRDAQAITYMTLLESCGMDNRNTFELFFAQQMYMQMLAGKEPDIGQCIRRVVLVDTYEDLVRNHTPFAVAASIRDKHNLDTIKMYNICARYWGPDPSGWVSDPDEDTVRSIASEAGIVGAKGIGKTNMEDTRKAIKAIVREAGRPFAVSQTESETVVTARPTVERFKAKVKDDLERLREYYKSTFPAEPVIECSKCEFRSMCTAETEGGDDDAGSE
jgi:hypothetical protein